MPARKIYKKPNPKTSFHFMPQSKLPELKRRPFDGSVHVITKEIMRLPKKEIVKKVKEAIHGAIGFGFGKYANFSTTTERPAMILLFENSIRKPDLRNIQNINDGLPRDTIFFNFFSPRYFKSSVQKGEFIRIIKMSETDWQNILIIAKQRNEVNANFYCKEKLVKYFCDKIFAEIERHKRIMARRAEKQK
ncbi:MAG: hypothetical protein Q7K42_04105 [Candidatus Diapherotrites archaeon]|nr:hypothetical protein [Candidatus Diapherotrites archaeon]